MANPVVGMPNCGLYQVKSLPVTERVILALLEQSYVVTCKRVMDLIGFPILLSLLTPLTAVLSSHAKA
jgi:hypothetical protein